MVIDLAFPVYGIVNALTMTRRLLQKGSKLFYQVRQLDPMRIDFEWVAHYSVIYVARRCLAAARGLSISCSERMG